MSWLLDTDVICQPAKKNCDRRVVAWLEAEQDRCYTSAVVIAQLAYWVRTKEGRQRQALQGWLTRLVDALHGRVVVVRQPLCPCPRLTAAPKPERFARPSAPRSA